MFQVRPDAWSCCLPCLPAWSVWARPLLPLRKLLCHPVRYRMSPRHPLTLSSKSPLPPSHRRRRLKRHLAIGEIIKCQPPPAHLPGSRQAQPTPAAHRPSPPRRPPQRPRPAAAPPTPPRLHPPPPLRHPARHEASCLPCPRPAMQPVREVPLSPLPPHTPPPHQLARFLFRLHPSPLKRRQGRGPWRSFPGCRLPWPFSSWP
jgi:hypothetical protein